MGAFFDSHARLDGLTAPVLEAVIRRADAVGVRRILAVGARLEMNTAALQAARQFPGTIRAAIGLGRVRTDACGRVTMVGHKMKTRIVNACFMALVLGVIPGCATVLVRDYPSCKPQGMASVYPASSLDAFCVVTGGGNLECKMGPMGYLVLSPLWLLDFPVSLVTDTVLLPSDLIWKRKDAEQRSREFILKTGELNEKVLGFILVSTSTVPEYQATFRCIPGLETVTLKAGGQLRSSDPVRAYTFLHSGVVFAVLRREE